MQPSTQLSASATLVLCPARTCSITCTGKVNSTVTVCTNTVQIVDHSIKSQQAKTSGGAAAAVYGVYPLSIEHGAPTSQAMHGYCCQGCLLGFALYVLPSAFESASMQALRQPGMRERHWQQLSEQLGMTLKPDKDFVLFKALGMHLMDHLDTIQKVPFSMHATKLLRSQPVHAAANLLQHQPSVDVHAVP